MKKAVVYFVFLSIIISACSIESRQDFTQIPEPTFTQEPTNTQEPTSTPTRIPLSDIELEEILIKEGDLPAGYSGAQIRDTAPEMFNDLPRSQNTIYQQLAKGGDQKGGVTIFLYDSQDDLDSAFFKIKTGFSEEKQLEEVGEEGLITYFSQEILGIKIQFGDLLFVRCNAVVHIRMTDLSSENSLITYAKRLDKRLSELVCP